jgi:hypothetical protein
MRDECFRRQNSLDSALSRCFAHREKLTFYNEAQKAEFFRLIDELWQKIVKKYNYKIFFKKL